MIRATAVNGSPRMDMGYTARILNPFVEGMKEAGCETKNFFASKLKVKSCVRGTMYCWYENPGQCFIKDDMQLLYPVLKQSEILILASPVYIPLPGAMQNILNRLCPLLEPVLEFRSGRTRARLRNDVKIEKMVLIATCGWWEKENFDTLIRIVRELAEDASVEFSGTVLRPHAFLMEQNGKLTAHGKAVLAAAKTAGKELIINGEIKRETLFIA